MGLMRRVSQLARVPHRMAVDDSELDRDGAQRPQGVNVETKSAQPGPVRGWFRDHCAFRFECSS